MKKRFYIMLLLLSAASCINAQKVEFTADINEMLPISYPARTGLSGFSFEMKNDSAFVHLPYMGEVYNPTFDNDGHNFDEPCKDIKIKNTKKNDGRKISFGLRHDIVSYKFDVTLWDNGSIDILMIPSNAQSCNYMGNWTNRKNEKKK